MYEAIVKGEHRSSRPAGAFNVLVKELQCCLNVELIESTETGAERPRLA